MQFYDAQTGNVSAAPAYAAAFETAPAPGYAPSYDPALATGPAPAYAPVAAPVDETLYAGIAYEIHALRFIRRARGLGFSMHEIETLLGLWRDQRRASKEVKRLALKHVAELDSKIEELQSMRAVLAELAAHCHGDSRPDCPILDDLGQTGAGKAGHCHEA